MSTSDGVLVVLEDSALREGVERAAAAAGVRMVAAAAPPSRRAWVNASAVVLDAATAAGCASLGVPRRDRVFVLSGHDAGADVWEPAVSVGAQRVLRFPADEQQLVAAFTDIGESGSQHRADSRTVAVIGARGGCGASVFSAALATVAAEPLLVDLDPWGGGIDLLLGAEHKPGLRWPDLALSGGRLNPSALRDALPRTDAITILSGTRAGGDVAASALRAVLDAGRRAGATVVCDLPRRLTPAATAALDAADLVVVISQCDVRCCASLAAMAPSLLAANPNVGLVVRGPAPGGLRAAELAGMVDLPLLATVRADPGLAETVEYHGLRLRRRSALVAAANRVLAVLDRQPRGAAA